MKAHALLSLSLFLFGTAALAESEYDLKWIGSLPGISSSVRKTAPGEHKAVYTLTADVDETLAKIRSGLTERGWTVNASKGVSLAGAVVRSVEADKGSAHVKVGATGTAGAINLDVQMSGGSGGGGVVTRTADDLSIMQGSVKKTYRCEGNKVSIMAGDCHITLQGHCASLDIAGGNNVVKIEGSVGPISVVGSGNRVSWSAAANPSAPSVSVMGADNDVHSEK